MDFWARVIQETRGCDYTIACGERTFTFQADSWDAATEWLKHRIIGLFPDPTDGDWPGYWDNRIGCASLAQIVHVKPMPVQEWYSEGTAEREEISRLALEETERQVYERLKQKFEEGNK